MGKIDETIKQLDEKGIEEVGFVTVSLTGERKAIQVPYSKQDPDILKIIRDNLTNGKTFDGSSVKGFRRITNSDMLLMPDLDSMFISPLEKGVAYFMCDAHELNKRPFVGDGRVILGKQVARAKRMGYEARMGPELEFFLQKGGKLHEGGKYFTDQTREGREFRNELTKLMMQSGIIPILHHHEVARGQHEVNFLFSDPIKTADNVVKMKYLTRMLAQDKGMTATYIPKFEAGQNGSGMHTHQSLTKMGIDAFGDGDGLSKIGAHYVAGILKYLPEITAVLNPIPTSYKRLVPGFEAPNLVCWGGTNRSCAVRVPYGAPRAEVRSPDPTSNPYLAFTLMLAAGLDGIEQKLPLAPETKINAFELSPEDRKKRGIRTLPGSLDEALDLFERSDLAKTALGSWTFGKVLEEGRKEARSYRENVTNQVTAWEHEQYLER